MGFIDTIKARAKADKKVIIKRIIIIKDSFTHYEIVYTHYVSQASKNDLHTWFLVL